MSETIFNDYQLTDLASSPTSISWFIDRTGDLSLLENLNPRRISWSESDHIIFEEQVFIDSSYPIINNSRYFEEYSQPAARTGRIILNNNLNNNLNNIANFVVCSTIVNTIVHVVIDENMEVTADQQECCICMEEKDKTDICLLSCRHSFCIDCSSRSFASQYRSCESVSCPLCRKDVTNICVQSTANRDKFLMR